MNSIPDKQESNFSATPASETPPSATGGIILIPWALGIAAVVLTRYRGQWPAYHGLHRWMAERGVPDDVRNTDSLLIYIATAMLGAWIVGRLVGERATALLRLRRGWAGWWRMVIVACLPMVAGGALLSLARGTFTVAAREALSRCYTLVIRAPIGEELIIRGLLVAVPAACIGWRGRRFWIDAVLAGLCFGALHLTWTLAGLSAWPTLLVTTAGGIWFAWLLSQWQSLWAPMALHAGMNLGWLLMGATGGASGGGLLENLLRVATIAIATAWTIRATAGDSCAGANSASATD